MKDQPTLINEPGIPELEKLYNDKYSFVKAAYIERTPESQKAYNEDLKKFYTAFAGNTEMPETIKKFSDIPLNQYEKFPHCKTGEFNLKYNSDEYKKIVGNSDLFADYGNHFKEMINKSNKIEQELLEILESVFIFLVDKKSNKKTLIINPKLNIQKLDELIVKVRDAIIKLYIGCENDFVKGIQIFNSIITEIKIKTSQQRGKNLKNLELSMVGEKPISNEELTEYVEEKQKQTELGKIVNVELLSDTHIIPKVTDE